MMTLCRECGKPASPEYADEHDGLCMACAHRPVTVYGPFTVEGEPLTPTMKALGITGIVVTPELAAKCMPYIDHDMAQPDSDWIADAIDRACVDLLDYGHDPDLDASGRCRICGEYEPE